MQAGFLQKLMAYGKQFHTCCLLHSNGISASCDHNRYDWLAAFGARRVLKAYAGNAFHQLAEFHNRQPGWLFGFLAYDLKNETEALSSANYDGLGLPDLYFFEPEYLLFSQQGNIRGDVHLLPALEKTEAKPEQPQPSFTTSSRISRDQYLAKARAVHQHLTEGNVYELNLCMEFFAENAFIKPEETWLRLNSLSPMPFAGFLKFEQNYLLCASPERFLMKDENLLVSQPIKGTTRRAATPAEDELVKEQLAGSEKERSENIMIVDLVRNDLARSAVPGSVHVQELCGIQSFAQLHQLVSTVAATPLPGHHFTDIITNAFPMGSMTGCPKIAAMQLIEELEETKRGLFSGSLGYITPSGNFDLNVVIRSILYNSQRRYLSYQAGSAITWLAQAELEYEECMLKAANMQRVLQGG